jgi:hypothetical protein
VRWSSDRGAAGTAANAAAWSISAPLLEGANNITITATDSANAAVTRVVAVVRLPPAAPAPAAVNLQITYPGPAGAYSTTAAGVVIKGTASHPAGIKSVQWSNSRGGSGLATGTAWWETGTVSLSDGLNVVTLKATAADNSTATAAVQITCNRSSARDTTSPSLAIASPAVNSVTTAASVVVQGTAGDNVGVTRVSWFTADGRGGEATGTVRWQTPAIPIYVGYNTIVVRAFDAAGNMGWRVVQVTRR